MGNGADFGEFHLHLFYLFSISNQFQSSRYPEKHYAWLKKTLRRTFVSLGKTVFSPFGLKNTTVFPQETKVCLRVFLHLTQCFQPEGPYIYIFWARVVTLER